MSGYGVRLSSLVGIVCKIQTSGKCTPDWLLDHLNTSGVSHLLRNVDVSHAFAECEHMRRWLFDDLPFNEEIGAHYLSAEAGLLEYLGRVHAQSWYSSIINKW